QSGRDHWANSWSTVLAGGGIRGGQAYGQTSADGTAVTSERPTSVPDFIATIAHALGVNPGRENMSHVSQPIRIVDRNGRPIREVLALPGRPLSVARRPLSAACCSSVFVWRSLASSPRGWLRPRRQRTTDNGQRTTPRTSSSWPRRGRC